MKKLFIQFSLIFIFLMTILICFISREYEVITSITEQIKNLGVWAPIIYFLIYILSPIFFVPISPIAIAGGFLFGPLWGTIYSVIGASAAAALAFLAGRYFAHDWVEKNVKGVLSQIKDGIENEGWHFIAFSRLVPIFPYNILNFTYGLTKISFKLYLFTTFLAIMPGAFAYVYLGYVGKEAVSGASGLVLKISIAIGLLLFVTMAAKFIRKKNIQPTL